MVVAIDATPLTVSSGGVRRYTEELTRALSGQFPEDTYHLISDQYPPRPLSALDRRWWTIGVQRAMSRLRCEVFHGTDFSVPYLPLKPSVLTIQDLSPWLEPAWHSSADRVRRRTPLLIGLNIPTMIITPTEAIRRQTISHFDIHPSRVIAVPDAASPDLLPVTPSLDERPYFLFVGTIEPRKNVPTLIEAWQLVRREHEVDLILAGRRRADAPAIREVPGLIAMGEVPDGQIASLYSGAIACVYPSLYEGFGLPPLEAMQCGCPVITSRDPAIMEVCDNAAIHVEAVDTTALAQAMEQLLLNTGERQRRRDLGLKRAAQFSWTRTAAMTREVYAEAIRRF